MSMQGTKAMLMCYDAFIIYIPVSGSVVACVCI